jgi:hypothetical protein
MQCVAAKIRGQAQARSQPAFPMMPERTASEPS